MSTIFSKRKPAPQKHLVAHKFICWDVDPTGRKLIDEMCQIAAYTPDLEFRQYIMPHRDVEFVYKKRHQIKTVNVGRFRVLKETTQGKVLRTKSELYALIDFMNWIDSLKGDEPIVLITFEQYKLAPCLLIEALKRYGLLQQFCDSVHGFANAYHFVKQKCELSMSSFSLKTLAKILLNKDQEETYSAHNRAKLTHEILEHLCVGEFEDEPCPALKAVEPYLSTVEQEEKEIQELKFSLQWQNTFKPIFSNLLRDSKTRKRATLLRRYLTNSLILFDELKKIWEQKTEQDTLEDFLEKRIKFHDDLDKSDLIKIIEEYFNKDIMIKERPVKDVNTKGGYNKKPIRKNRKHNVKPVSIQPKAADSDEVNDNVNAPEET